MFDDGILYYLPHNHIEQWGYDYNHKFIEIIGQVAKSNYNTYYLHGLGLKKNAAFYPSIYSESNHGLIEGYFIND